MIEIIILIATLVSIIFYLLVQYRYQYWKRQGIPYVKPKFFFGNTQGVDVKQHHTTFWKEIYQELKHKGPVGGFFNFLDPSLIVHDLDLLRTIFIKDFDYFTDRAMYHNIPKDPISGHLIALEGEDWKFMRSKLSPAFSSGKMKQMHVVVDHKIDELLSVIEETRKPNESFEIRDIFARFITDILGITAFGIECNSIKDENSQYHQVARYVLRNLNFRKKAFMENNRGIFQKLGFVNTPKPAAEFYTKVVDGIMDYRKTEGVERNDFMGMMLATKDTSRELTRNEILAQSAVFMVGGHDTQLTAMTYTIYELAINPELQRKAREEVQSVVEKYDGKVTYDSIVELKYIEQCIYETLRKYFIAFSARREVRKDYKVPNTNIVLKKGTIFQVPVFAIHNDPEIYPNPDVYDPDRFSPEECQKRHPFAFIPFGEGPRLCIGKRFAMMNTKSTLGRILLNYEFTLDYNKTPVPLEIDPLPLFVTPVGGIYLKLKKLNP